MADHSIARPECRSYTIPYYERELDEVLAPALPDRAPLATGSDIELARRVLRALQRVVEVVVDGGRVHLRERHPHARWRYLGGDEGVLRITAQLDGVRVGARRRLRLDVARIYRIVRALPLVTPLGDLGGDVS